MPDAVRLIRLADQSPAELKTLFARAEQDIAHAYAVAQPVIDAIKAEGDAALIRLIVRRSRSTAWKSRVKRSRPPRSASIRRWRRRFATPTPTSVRCTRRSAPKR